ncbi:Universal stress protein family protein [Streptomyces sp. Ncost-T6T-2b]|nr:Universal stress protein family protein [Streptomyces sp. Ncost-T6T-2b]
MGRIVVGVDGSDSSIKALHWAVRQAELTGATVEAVNSWEYPATSWASMMPGMPEDFDPQAVATVALTEALEEALGAAGPPRSARSWSSATLPRPCWTAPRAPTCSSWEPAATPVSRPPCSARSASTSPSTRRAR